MRPIVIDCESSGLDTSLSYPIEVGVAMDDGTVLSYLIKPEASWEFWDAESEKIHNIPRSDLYLHGLLACDVANKLNSQLCGEVVYSDAVDYDSMWIDRLFRAVNIERRFDICSLFDLIHTNKQYTSFYAEKRRLFAKTTRHRAGNDAQVLQGAIVYAKDEL